MVDNRVSTVSSTTYFKAGDASGMANKMSEEKQGQGGEYFAQDMQEEQEQQQRQNQNFQDRSAILRASLNGLAVANVGLVRFNRAVQEQEERRKQEEQEEKKKKKLREDREIFTRFDEIFND